jgi:guanidinopropionase
MTRSKKPEVEAAPSSRRGVPASQRAGAHAFRPARSEALPRYAGVASFLRLPSYTPPALPDVDVLLTGVPFDGGTSYRPGARLGPRAVREASALARSFSSALGVDIYSELRVADGGDVVVPPHDLRLALEAVAGRAEAIARSGVLPGFVGGDQCVTLGALRGLHRAKLKSFGLLHIDCHSNTNGPAWGHEVHHGSVVRAAVEEGLVRRDAVLQLGLRGPYSSADELDWALAQGFELVDMDEIKWDLHAALSAVRKLARGGPLYVSVDIAALDPAYAPGTGIPLPGGMNTWELQQVLRALVGADLVGFDLVEIAPAYDPTGITALAGVTIVQEILSALADTRRSARPAPSSRDPRRGRRISP